MRIKVAGLAAAVTALAGGVLVTGAGAADAAAPAAKPLRIVVDASSNFTTLRAWDGDEQMGYGQWSKDPQSDGTPGDALRAADTRPDGWAIYAYLSDGRMATTSGHNYPYTTGWVGPNLPEDQTYVMTVCVQRDGVEGGCAQTYVSS